jgi:uncharacterized protein YjiS (DUF1127 family)
MIMSTVLSASAALERPTGSSPGLLLLLKRWCLAYFTWRIEKAAIAHLLSMSDQQLKDIGGLTRSQVEFAVKGKPKRRTSMLLP